MSEAAQVMKLGGSLLDLADLAARLEVVRRARGAALAALVVGGGDAADLVRAFDRSYGLGEVKGHWLAVRAMQFNAHLVAAALPDAALAADIGACHAAWAAGRLAVIDPLPWLEREEAAGIAVPHRWSFTSDSIAAHIAVRLQAGRLTLLKSTTSVANVDDVLCYPFANDPRNEVWEAVAEGLIDADFEAAAAGIASIEVINLRDASLARGEILPAAVRVLR